MASHYDRWQSVQKPTHEAKNALRSLGEVGRPVAKRSKAIHEVKNVPPMFYAYILRSQWDANVFYHGFTSDLRKRLEAHNTGANVSTRASLVPGMVWCLRIRTDGSRFRVLSQNRFGQSLCAKAATPKCLSKNGGAVSPRPLRRTPSQGDRFVLLER